MMRHASSPSARTAALRGCARHRRARLALAATLVVAAGVVAGLFGMVTPSASADGIITPRRRAVPGGYFIPPVHYIGGTYGAYAGKCVDVPNGIPADGEQLQIWDCNQTAAQTWTSGPQGQAMAFGMCMDVAWGSTDNGAKVQLAWCYPNDPAQHWVINPEGDLFNPQSGRCLDVSGWQSGNGAPLQIWDCTGGANQNWHLSYLGGGQGP